MKYHCSRGNTVYAYPSEVAFSNSSHSPSCSPSCSLSSALLDSFVDIFKVCLIKCTHQLQYVLKMRLRPMNIVCLWYLCSFQSFDLLNAQLLVNIYNIHYIFVFKGFIYFTSVARVLDCYVKGFRWKGMTRHVTSLAWVGFEPKIPRLVE